MTSKKPGSSPDDLIRSKTVELTEEELDNASGGAVNLNSIDGESQDHKHKDTLRIESLKPR